MEKDFKEIIAEASCPKSISISIDADGVLEITSDLSEKKHEYIWSDYFPIEEILLINGTSEVQVCLLSSSPRGLSIALIFYNKYRQRIGDGQVPANQSMSIAIPEGVTFFRMALRVQGQGVFCIDRILCGGGEMINNSLSKLLECNYKKAALIISKNESRPLILIETVFCDTENNPLIIRRYLSYLIANIWLLKASNYRDFKWCIYYSSDKFKYAEIIKDEIHKSNQCGQIILIKYDHPRCGYKNESETHIDRIRRPNSTYSERRDGLFEKFKQKIPKAILTDQIYIRMAIDDDDFILPDHLNRIAHIASREVSKTPDEEIILAFCGVLVSKFLVDNKVQMDVALITRAITGNKFSIARSSFPLHPFAISEKFDEIKKMVRPGRRVIVDKTRVATISYNRHGQNFSSAAKDYFYDSLLSTHHFKSSEDYFDFLLTDHHCR